MMSATGVLAASPGEWGELRTAAITGDGASAEMGSRSYVASADAQQEQSSRDYFPDQAGVYEKPTLSIVRDTFPRQEDSSVNEPPTNERVAKLEATIDTVRAEIRASNAETREAILTAVERLRGDGQTLRADVIKDVMSVRMWVLRSVAGSAIAIIVAIIGVAAWVAEQFLGPILQHLIK